MSIAVRNRQERSSQGGKNGNKPMEMIGKGGRAIGRSSDGDSEKGPLNIERKKASGQRESVGDTQATT